MSKTLSKLALAATLLLPSAVGAQERHPEWWGTPRPGDTLEGRIVDVQIQVDGDRAWLYDSPRWADDRRYFEAFAGRNYSIVLHNQTAERIGVLVAVDGVNAVSGERTQLAAGEAMYVLDPYERAVIAGWRTSLDHVRRFVFVDEKRSYAERSGQANSDMGWIRVLGYRELLPYRLQPNEIRREEELSWRQKGRDDERSAAKPSGENAKSEPYASSAPNASDSKGEPASGEPSTRTPPTSTPSTQGDATFEKAQPRSGLAKKDQGSFPGTGWGDRRYDPVHETRFVVDGPAVDQLVLRYEYASGLLALGIEPWHGGSRHRLQDRDRDYGFAQPPRW